MASKRRVAVWALTFTADTALTPQLPNMVARLDASGNFPSSTRESLGPKNITPSNGCNNSNDFAGAVRAGVDEPEEVPDTASPLYTEARSPSVTLGERCEETRECSQLGADRAPRRGVGPGLL